MHYRDKITFENNATLRANVYVLNTEVRASTGGAIERVIITVTIPPSERQNVPVEGHSFDWQGATFYRRGIIVPIMALGRVDHYEITAVSDESPA